MTETYSQQGDCLLKPIKAVKGAKKIAGSLLHKGEQHHHRLSGGKFTILEKEGKRYLSVTKATTLTHEEHKTFALPKGFYALSFVQEYDHFLEESRNVID